VVSNLHFNDFLGANEVQRNLFNINIFVFGLFSNAVLIFFNLQRREKCNKMSNKACAMEKLCTFPIAFMLGSKAERLIPALKGGQSLKTVGTSQGHSCTSKTSVERQTMKGLGPFHRYYSCVKKKIKLQPMTDRTNPQLDG
jgi:hypothetical protein